MIKISVPLRRFLPSILFLLVLGHNAVQFSRSHPAHPASGELSEASRDDTAFRVRIAESYARLPVSFEINRGQFDARVRFVARGAGYTAHLTGTEAYLSLRRIDPPAAVAMSRRMEWRQPLPKAAAAATVRLTLAGANADPRVEGLEPADSRSNYLLGNDPAKWHVDVPHFNRIRCLGLYPGIDMDYYSSQRQLEYDFTVAPGADPSRIRMRFEGPLNLKIGGEGELILETAAGIIRQARPLAYQQDGKKRQRIESSYELKGYQKGQETPEIGIRIGAYDSARPLIIDPLVIAYSTYLGGDRLDSGNGIAADSAGSAYVIGRTISANFPTTHPIQSLAGGNVDTVVFKLNAAGTDLIYSTYLGGGGNDFGQGITVDENGSAYVVGATGSTDFPTRNPLQPASGGGMDVFLCKLNPAGTALDYSTYLGGSGEDIGSGIALGKAGAIHVTGLTTSADFPVRYPLQPVKQGDLDAFVSKVDSTGTVLIYSTFLGGTEDDIGLGIAVDSIGAAYASGQTDSTDFPVRNPLQAILNGPSDGFVVKLDTSGTSLVYATYLGGEGDDYCLSIAVDKAGAAYVAGDTTSTQFPLRSPFQPSMRGSEDSYVSKLNPSGIALAYSTYLGGTAVEQVFGIAVDGAGSAYVTGLTTSADFPTENPVQAAYGGNLDAFISRLRPNGAAMIFSTYLGGSAQDGGYGIAIDGAGSVYVAGPTYSVNFPVRNPLQAVSAGPSDTFICKLTDDVVPVPSLNEWGLMALAILLSFAGILIIRRRSLTSRSSLDAAA